MNFFKSLFNGKKEPINSYADFWEWFEKHENKFYKVLKNDGDIQSEFFHKLGPKLTELKEGFWYLAGMFDDDTAELILTADGITKNIVFTEELVAAAPKMKHWKITALKQPSNISKYSLEMNGHVFSEDTLFFYSNDHPHLPDEIDITITHEDFSEATKNNVVNGVYLTLDNFLGELNTVTTIDNIHIINTKDATKELVPIRKLKDFLIWREKEFIEKYKGLRHDTENDSYAGLEAFLENGLPLFAVVNTDVLNWDSKASHPWIAVLEIKYDGKNTNGMPDEKTYQLLSEIEDKIVTELKDADGYINIGRQTADSSREVYFACIEFRKPSKVLYNIQQEYQNSIKIDFDIYKDKYWQSFDRFIVN
ncbi:DUF695 domain-containing protein [uncultured Kordia sp.]|uniref:DUF695 domain-containing protein n=1 Tax=uncultured Kordia sp. TaxID=507699 RepID=UPI0026337CAF|nr:DUF695 domain-containing protein [uncultured Kordia sp.]